MNAPLVTNIAEIGPRIEDVLRRHIDPPRNQPRNRCSNAGDPCERRLVMRRTHGEEATPVSVDLQSIFDVGREHESAMVHILEEAGLRLLERERPYEWIEHELGGSIDGKLEIGGQRIITDGKSSHPFVWDGLPETSLGLLDSRHHWLRHYVTQMDLYIAMDQRQGGKSGEGVFLFRNKTSGRIKPVPHVLDDNRVSDTLAKLQRVNGHVHAGTLPERIDPDAGACARCPFALICLPDDARQDGIGLSTDEDFIALLEARAALAPKAKQYQTLDEAIKARVKATDVTKLFAGDFQITKRHQSRKEYTVKASEFDVVTIVSMKGESDVDG